MLEEKLVCRCRLRAWHGGKRDWRKLSRQRLHADGFSRTIEVSFAWPENRASRRDTQVLTLVGHQRHKWKDPMKQSPCRQSENDWLSKRQFKQERCHSPPKLVVRRESRVE